jgi:hypothetical protein
MALRLRGPFFYSAQLRNKRTSLDTRPRSASLIEAWNLHDVNPAAYLTDMPNQAHQPLAQQPAYALWPAV